jgi:hypothetical protein
MCAASPDGLKEAGGQQGGEKTKEFVLYIVVDTVSRTLVGI